MAMQCEGGRSMRARILVPVLVACALLAACGESRNYDQAICVLVDVSGTYAEEKPEVVRLIKREILPNLVPGDTLIVIQIDSLSYEKDNLISHVTLDRRPSQSNAQKLALAQALDAFVAKRGSSKYTDIPGAMMLGAEYLREAGSDSRVILIFSDMRQDLPKGARREFSESEFDGIRIAAMNVKRLKGDTADPAAFRKRLEKWDARVKKAGGLEWRTFMDPEKLGPYLEEIR